jgi:hypothetical protein
MFKLIAIVVLSSVSQEPVMLEGKTRFPTEAQCQAQIDEAKEKLQKQVDSIGAKVVSVRCVPTKQQDL